MSFLDQEALDARAALLEASGLNGLDFVLVSLPAVPGEAQLELHFINSNGVAAIAASGDPPKTIFPLRGGHRVKAGDAAGEVQVHTIAPDPQGRGHVLRLTVRPIGDYSTYTLGVDFTAMDPVFDELEFKFRPGCFSNCDPECPEPEPVIDPAIDYLAKDFDSFRHALIAAMQERVPGWTPSSEVDLSQVLLSLFSAAADELSDYQDRVMNEAYLATARNRVSLARHARLMDYHIHQGNQASTWLAVHLVDGVSTDLPLDFRVWTGDDDKDPRAVHFVGRSEPPMHHLLNDLKLFTWSGSRPGLAAGATSADLELTVAGEPSAVEVRDLIRDGEVPRLLIQEHLNPATGREAGSDPQKRQLLQLEANATEIAQDPLTGTWYVHVEWRAEDQLHYDYCFDATTEGGAKISDVSMFHGNLVEAFHGAAQDIRFKSPGETLTADPDFQELHYEKTDLGVVCRLPDDLPVLYRKTEPRSEQAPISTLEIDGQPRGEKPQIKVVTTTGTQEWEEASSLVNSREDADQYVVETDELRRSTIRFGNGTNGRALPDRAEVRCWYQSGDPSDGNIGADRLVSFNEASVAAVWNPFDVTDAREPEPVDEILRNVPEAYRTRQLRAITLADYIDRAEAVDGVARAAARYAWTGSWRTVQVAIDPESTDVLDDELRLEVARHLEAVRLIGEDLEIRGPRLVPLEIDVKLCVDGEFWPEDVRSVLEREFSDGFTSDGRRGFFHPDEWTFGQYLRSSEILGRVHQVAGVDHVVSVDMQRFDAITPGTEDVIEVAVNEIVQVRNDPDHMELGVIRFDLRGGRQ